MPDFSLAPKVPLQCMVHVFETFKSQFKQTSKGCTQADLSQEVQLEGQGAFSWSWAPKAFLPSPWCSNGEVSVGRDAPGGGRAASELRTPLRPSPSRNELKAPKPSPSLQPEDSWHLCHHSVPFQNSQENYKLQLANLSSFS